MADINVANDTEVFSDDYPIIYKTEDDIIRELNFKNPEDEAITRAIVESLERNIAKHLQLGKAVAIPYVGVLRKNPLHKAMRKHTKEMKFARRTMVKEDYAEYCYRIYKLEKENIRLKASTKQAITTIRKNNSKKYFSLLSTYGKDMLMLIYLVFSLVNLLILIQTFKNNLMKFIRQTNDRTYYRKSYFC